jgi:hypothetical protein
VSPELSDISFVRANPVEWDPYMRAYRARQARVVASYEVPASQSQQSNGDFFSTRGEAFVMGYTNSMGMGVAEWFSRSCR